MDRWTEIALLVQIADAGSLSRAPRRWASRTPLRAAT